MPIENHKHREPQKPTDDDLAEDGKRSRVTLSVSDDDDDDVDEIDLDDLDHVLDEVDREMAAQGEGPDA